jgi:hypothetical protein
MVRPCVQVFAKTTLDYIDIGRYAMVELENQFMAC